MIPGAELSDEELAELRRTGKRVRLRVAGRTWQGWTGVTIARGLERVVSDFTLTLVRRGPESQVPILIRPHSSCIVTIHGEPVITGYVDRADGEADRSSSHWVVTGRSKTCDATDCHATAGPVWTNRKLEEIAGDLVAPHGLEVAQEVAGDEVVDYRIPRFKLQDGDKVFAAIDRLAENAGVLVTDDELGRVVITRPSRAPKSKTVLRWGENILAGSAWHDGTEVFSQITIKGRTARSDGDFGLAVNVGAFVEDDAVGRFRPLVVNANGRISQGQADQRAAFELAARIARSYGGIFKVRGWRQADGALWRPNLIADVEAAALGLVGELVVAEVAYSIDRAGGEVAVLTVADPMGFEPFPPTIRKPRASSRLWLTQAELDDLIAKLDDLQTAGI